MAGTEIYDEVATILYTPKYSLSNEYHHCIFNMRFLSPQGPARHLRRLRLDCSMFRLLSGGSINYPGVHAEHREVGLTDDVPFYESVLWAIARSATQLETLEPVLNPNVDYCPAIDKYLTEDLFYDCVPIKPDRSWIGPWFLDGVADSPRINGRKTGPPALPTEEQFGLILDFLAHGEAEMQRAIREKIEESCAPPVVELQLGELPHYHFWTSLYFHLWTINAERRLWGGVTLDVIRGCSPTLRVVDLVGRVDKKWTEAVAEVKGVMVRANSDWLRQADWVTVEPYEEVCDDERRGA